MNWSKFAEVVAWIFAGVILNLVSYYQHKNRKGKENENEKE